MYGFRNRKINRKVNLENILLRKLKFGKDIFEESIKLAGITRGHKIRENIHKYDLPILYVIISRKFDSCVILSQKLYSCEIFFQKIVCCIIISQYNIPVLPSNISSRNNVRTTKFLYNTFLNFLSSYNTFPEKMFLVIIFLINIVPGHCTHFVHVLVLS